MDIQKKVRFWAGKGDNGKKTLSAESIINVDRLHSKKSWLGMYGLGIVGYANLQD